MKAILCKLFGHKPDPDPALHMVKCTRCTYWRAFSGEEWESRFPDDEGLCHEPDIARKPEPVADLPF